MPYSPIQLYLLKHKNVHTLYMHHQEFHNYSTIILNQSPLVLPHRTICWIIHLPQWYLITNHSRQWCKPDTYSLNTPNLHCMKNNTTPHTNNAYDNINSNYDIPLDNTRTSLHFRNSDLLRILSKYKFGFHSLETDIVIEVKWLYNIFT